MLRNYIVTALRGIKRNRVFTLVNLTGLSVAMCCFILVGLYVNYELSYDQFHKNVENIHIVKLKLSEEFGGTYSQFLPAAFANIIEDGTPGLEGVTTTLSGAGSMYVVTNEQEYLREKYYTIENSFFDVFSFPFLYGNNANALTEPTSVVISREMALKYFNNENAIGEILTVDGKGDFRVTGILQDFPENSQFQPHFSFSLNSAPHLDAMGSGGFFIYIKTLPNANLGEIEKRMTSLYDANKPKGIPYEEAALGSFADSYWQQTGSGAARNNSERGLGANKDIIYTCSGLAVLLLFIALANYVNMATAKAMERAKEVGIRKVNGATQNQLIKQFLGETLFFALLCLIAAVIMVEILLPSVSQIMGISLKMDYQDITILGFLAVYTLSCGLLAGIYPAVLLSRFNPVKALKGQKQQGGSRFSHRSALLFFQFTISAFMIIVLLVANTQINHYLNFDLGFNKEHVVSIRMTNEMDENPDVFMQEIRNISGVEGLTFGPLPFGASGSNDLEYQSKIAKNASRVETDENFIDMLEIPLLAGRNFDPEMPSDVDNAIIINETLAKKLELENPIGVSVLFAGTSKTVIGLIKDFHISGAMTPVTELSLMPLQRKRRDNLLIKVNAQSMASTLGKIDAVWDQFDFKDAYQYQFLDDAYEEKLSELQRLTLIVNGVTIAIVVISLFGLFSLVAFQTSQRLKEIGIRKVLGATANNILIILAKPYAWLILSSSLFAIPLAYSVMSNALNQFINPIDLDASFGLVTVFILLCFSTLVLLSRTISTIKTNPVDILRNE
jgi:putative ABC transport system permease protein